MSGQAQAYPLAWPVGRARTPAHRRSDGPFRSGKSAITVGVALERLDLEVRRLGGSYPLLSSNLERRLDGAPILNRGEPADPGVCCYFALKGEPFAMACDAYTRVAQNIAALAAHIEATRAIARYGVATAAETLQAFRALPPPGPDNRPPLPWYDVLEVAPTAALEVIEAAFRVQARKAHPDVPGGSRAAMQRLNEAVQAGRRAAGGAP